MKFLSKDLASQEKVKFMSHHKANDKQSHPQNASVKDKVSIHIFNC